MLQLSDANFKLKCNNQQKHRGLSLGRELKAKLVPTKK
jgi:hypothetical protein